MTGTYQKTYLFHQNDGERASVCVKWILQEECTIERREPCACRPCFLSILELREISLQEGSLPLRRPNSESHRRLVLMGD